MLAACTALEAMTRAPLRFLRSPWPLRSLAYLLPSALLAVAGVGLAFTVYAYGPVAAGALGVAASLLGGLGLARFERWRLRLVDLEPARDPHRPPGGPGVRAWLRTRLREQATWREVGFAAVSLAALWVIDLGVVSLAGWLPVMLMSAPLQPGMGGLPAVPLALAGAAALPLASYPVTAWAGARASVTRAVLAPRDAELGEVVRSRARLMDAFESERRRIERDLHDGAQQRLVALSMKLGLARLDLPPGSPAARQVAEAHEEAKRALAELRELIRGVHPQVLTDRGLPAAVRDVAGRSPVPVEVDIPLRERLPAPVEVTAYYVATEALANVAKHSGAARCRVRGRLRGDVFRLEVHDDGAGGADPAAGTGLAGLADRLAVLDGAMSISSPPGGPTTLLVEIPCPASA
ncbi:signal transduction histidine kinase [Thermocatellispora tengchongensis]|uniref:histidine kinase n=1 Tax=Thermocatellispora tengchongensis TaxID=1073253 RepID=A0A840PKB5_9ACTN|nr:sensor domain-containing protein [Thermocatellispora tengchongensis]MBB5136495.1 signal transduction histidine kinase [Thermocatellispora tengchongensis]